MQIEIVGHYDGTDNAHRLQQDIRVAVGAPGHKHPLKNFPLVGGWHNILKNNKIISENLKGK